LAGGSGLATLGLTHERRGNSPTGDVWLQTRREKASATIARASAAGYIRLRCVNPAPGYPLADTGLRSSKETETQRLVPSNYRSGKLKMQKLLAALIATLFAAGVAVAQDKKDEKKDAKKDAKPAAEAKKDAKKDAAKPAAKKEEKKEEAKK
jgi:hypothetical protein